ncbi:hypothetical protein [Flavobacterium sp. MK4S-17]|uniref:hypothetical protein n=1 Tax=Flavobacterium sp. MK4S-17 TaxID=2543737 RepID=UPI0013578596|nr:hypothetical protein [Flavobacterium sp. MK4S-17]
MKNILFLFLFLQLSLYGNAQPKKARQHLAVCNQGSGCRFSEITVSAAEVDKLLGKTGFWTTASPNATLILNNCESKKNEKLSLEEVDRMYGGSGKKVVIQTISLQKYLKEKGCFGCPNTTKKISFRASGGGQQGSSYFFLNLKAGEAYMPNEAFQKMANGEGGEMVVDQFIRNNAMDIYAIAGGKKYHQKMALGTTISGIKNDAVNEQRFKKDFRKTGKTRKHPTIGKTETEYRGKDDEGKIISFWIMPSSDVCLPKGKFDAFGFYNLGYISVDGITYLVTEISGNDFQIKLTGISDGTYKFNPAGYQSY